MSINSDGLRFRSADLGAAVASLAVLRPRLRAESRRRRMLFLARRATEIIDRAVLDGLPVERPLRAAAQELAERQARIGSELVRDPEVDHGFELLLIPHDGRIYGALFVEHAAWAEIVRSQPFVEDYAWWNGGDRPDAIGEADWEERARVWREITAIDPRLGGAGVGFGFLPWEGAVSAEELADFAPLRQARARALARETVLADQTKALGRPATPREILAMIRALEAPEIRILLAAAAEDIAARLPEVTVDLLRHGVGGRGSPRLQPHRGDDQPGPRRPRPLAPPVIPGEDVGRR